MVQQNDLRIKLNNYVGFLINECKTSKFRLSYSTDFLFMSGGALDAGQHVYVLLGKIGECCRVKVYFEHKLSKDAQ